MGTFIINVKGVRMALDKPEGGRPQKSLLMSDICFFCSKLHQGKGVRPLSKAGRFYNVQAVEKRTSLAILLLLYS